MHRGTLSLDLDGTLTTGSQPLSVEVVRWLQMQQKRGWVVLFNTVRSFTFALRTIGDLPFENFVAVQSGGALVDASRKKLLTETRIPLEVLQHIPAWEEKYGQAFVVEGGFSLSDHCFYHPAALSEENQKYLDYRQQLQGHAWLSLEQWEACPCKNGCALIKVYGEGDVLESLKREVDEINEVSCTQINDPFRPGYQLLVITPKGGDKGSVIQKFFSLGLGSRPLISAGDEMCDLPMLEISDLKVASEKSALELRSIGDILFSPQQPQSILNALGEAITLLEKNGR